MKKSTPLIIAICMLRSAMLLAQAGSLDISFSTDGKVTTAITNATDYGKAVALQSDGKIVVAGYINNGTDYDFAVARYNTNGSLDNTFDGDGKVTTAIGSSSDEANAVAIQGDGKIVVAGYIYTGVSFNRIFAIARYNTNGALDNTFDSDGKVTTVIGGTDDRINSVAIQSDGKIVVAGYSSNGTKAVFALARYNTNGSLDNTFDTDGIVTTALGSSSDVGNSVVLQSDGKIVVGGYSIIGFYANFAVARYTTTGALDNTFDTDGIATTPIGSSNSYGNSVAIHSDGKIVVAGSTYNVNNNTEDFAIARFTNTGALDNTFAMGQSVTLNFGWDDYIKSVAIQGDGKIVVAGSSLSGASRAFTVARYTTAGALDNTFDTDGIQITDIGPSGDLGNAVVIQSNGKIVVAGYSSTIPAGGVGAGHVFALVRYNTTGSLDNTFDTDGIVTTDIGSSYDYGRSVAIQSDGKILVAGYRTIDSGHDFALARYTTDGWLDGNFSSDGKVATAIGSSDDRGHAVALQSDGKIVVAGYSNNGTDNDFALVRYNTNGSLDNTFDSDGKATTAIGSSNDAGYSVAIQSDGKILVAGYSINGTNADFALVRYNTNGSLDNTFDTDGKVTTAIGSANDYGWSVVLQSDGKILVAGSSSSGTKENFALVRYNSNGSLDNTFDNDGKLTTAIGNANDNGWPVALQSDGKIVVAGSSYNGTNYDFALVRYNTNGTLDNTFDTDGKVTTAIGSSSDYGYSVVLQSDGKILVAGHSLNGSNGVFAVARYNSTGSLDNTFDTDGKATTDFGSSDDRGLSVALQSDGKIVVAGYSYNGANDDFAVVRYNNTLSSSISSRNILCNGQCIGTATVTPIAGISPYTYNWSNGKTTKTVTGLCVGTYTVIVTDSVSATATSIVTITQPSVLTLTVTANGPTNFCQGNNLVLTALASASVMYKWSTGSTRQNITVNQSGSYTVTVTNSCGSIGSPIIVVTVNPLPNISTALNGNIITATQSGAIYQWLNCNTGNSPVSGATAKSYTVTANGSYAVKVTQGGCSDTSTCVNVNSLGISQPVLSEVEGGVRLYPNPFSNILTIDLGNNISVLIVDIIDLQGRTVISQTIEQGKTDINTENLAKGIYVVRVASNDNHAAYFKMIKEE